MTGETATITGAGYTVTINVISVSHQLDKMLVINEIPAKGQEDTLTWLIDLRRCKEAVTISGYLKATSTVTGLNQSSYLINLMRKTAADLTLTWGAGGTYEKITGNISKVDIKEEPGRLVEGASPTTETKRFNVQLVFVRGSFRG